MKKIIVASIFIATLMFLTACGSSSDSETDSEKITLTSTIQAPENADLSKGYDAYLDEVEKLSDGQIEFDRYYSETLVKAADHLDAVDKGVADIGLLLPSYTPGKNPLANIESLPALWENQWAGTKAYAELYDEFPQIEEEFLNSNVEVVGHMTIPSYYVIGNEDISSFDDLKGKKLASSGGQSELAEALGANSVGIVITETFEAMEKGTADGAMLGLTGAATYGIHEVAESVWLLPTGSQGGVYGMNQDTFESLPEDLKGIFDEAASKNAVDFHEIYQVNAEKKSLELFKDANVTINDANEEDIEKLRNIASETVWKDWIDNAKKSDENAEEILDRFIELIDKYEKEFDEDGLPKL